MTVASSTGAMTYEELSQLVSIKAKQPNDTAIKMGNECNMDLDGLIEMAKMVDMNTVPCIDVVKTFYDAKTTTQLRIQPTTVSNQLQSGVSDDVNQ